jgi:hypothetical protein
MPIPLRSGPSINIECLQLLPGTPVSGCAQALAQPIHIVRNEPCSPTSVTENISSHFAWSDLPVMGDSPYLSFDEDNDVCCDDDCCSVLPEPRAELSSSSYCFPRHFAENRAKLTTSFIPLCRPITHPPQSRPVDHQQNQLPSSSPSLAIEESSSESMRRTRSVRFSEVVEVRFYELILGDHPVPKGGLALTFGWEYDPQSSYHNLEIVEQCGWTTTSTPGERRLKRRGNALRLSFEQRAQRLCQTMAMSLPLLQRAEYDMQAGALFSCRTSFSAADSFMELDDDDDDDDEFETIVRCDRFNSNGQFLPQWTCTARPALSRQHQEMGPIVF